MKSPVAEYRLASRHFNPAIAGNLKQTRKRQQRQRGQFYQFYLRVPSIILETGLLVLMEGGRGGLATII